jgi:nucleoside-diphosphate-sugar epimerase
MDAVRKETSARRGRSGNAMRILVTGGAGMIGSHLVDALLDGGNEIVVVDNFLTGRRHNLAHLAVSPRVHIVEADISATSHLPETVGPVDRVYHLASPASPIDYARHPLETLMTNAVGTRNALDVARRWHARFLVTSTSEIYGDPEQHPQPETYHGNVNSLGPRSCYDEGKRFAESLTMTYWRSYGVDVRIARLFNTYGPRSRSDDGRMVPTFCVQALSGQPLTIFGSGLQTRSLCYVSDTVAGLMALMEKPGIDGEVVNLGCPDERTILEIAQTIATLAGSSCQIERGPLPVDDPARRCPDITKAQRLLGWRPVTDLTTGLERTLAYFREEAALASGAAA